MASSNRIARASFLVSFFALGCGSNANTSNGAGGIAAAGSAGNGNVGGQSAAGGVASAGGGTAGGNTASGGSGTPGPAGGAATGTGGNTASGGASSTGGASMGGSSGGGASGASMGGASGGGASGGAAGNASGGAAGSLGAAGAANDCPGITPLDPGDHNYTINSANGLTYKYILTIPKSITPGKKTPVEVIWHALDSSPMEARSLTPIDSVHEAAGVITVFPISPDQSWDAGSCCTATAGGKRRDETVFAKELVKDFESKVCVDTKRIYTSGFSNGGMITQLFACKMADVFAAAAAMGSTLTIPADQCTPSRPIPIFMINGTADPLVGYNSPGLAGGISVPQAVQKWASLDMCTGMPMQTLMKGAATCNTYSQCAAGTVVEACAVQGMGHCMPGMKAESATNCLTKGGIPLGMPNNDIDGVQMSTDFLLKYSLP